MTTSQKYWEPITNDAGYVVLRPNVATENELLQESPVNPFAESAYPQFPLGTRAIRGVEEWLYCSAGQTYTVAGVPIQGSAAIHAEADDDIVVGAASAIGAYTVTLTSTANLAAAPLSTKDGFANGYLVVNDGPGQSQLRKIKSHEAASSTNDFVVTLYDPLTVALTTASEVGLIEHPCANVEAATAVTSRHFIGVNEIASITSGYYFWAKVKGPAAVLVKTAVALGTYLVVGTTSSMFNASAAVTTELIVGEMITPGVADGETAIAYLYGR